MSTSGWVNKENVLCIHTVGYYSAIKNEFPPFATTWVDFEGIMLSEISQKEEDNYHMTSLMFGIEKQNTKPQAHRCREQIGSCQRQGLGDRRNV